jgi:hypothetical protein
VSDHPHERRDWFVAQYARRLQAAGVAVPHDAIQRQAAEDLRLVDRARAAGAIADAKPAKRDEKQTGSSTERRAHAHQLAERRGGHFYKRDQNEGVILTPDGKARSNKPQRSKLPKLSGVEAMRLSKLLERVALLCSKRGHVRGKCIDEQDFVYPAYAKQIAHEFSTFTLGSGRYRDLSSQDKHRAYYRALTDICDRSNGAVGVGWWVSR